MTLKPSKGPTLGMRHMQALLIFLDIVVSYVARLNIGVAIVAMTNAETTNPNFPEFDWDEKRISYILSSFFWGYIITQFPGGALCRRFGAKWTMGVATFGSSILSALTPWTVVKGGWKAFCAIRLAQGLFQGVMFPSVHAHLAKWCPREERNRLGALSHTGVECGTVVALGISGVIAEGRLGWPGISYISAALGIAWCVLWLLFGYNNATESNFITKEERDYIELSLTRSKDFHKKKIPVPWKAIFSSIPFLTLMLMRCAQVWGLSTMQHQIPSYLHGVLNMQIKSNALFSALPFLAMWLLSYVFVIIADIIQHKNLMSLTALRRTFSTIASWLPAAGLVAIGFLDEDNKALALTLMTLLVGINSACILGTSLNTIDLSPNHAGILMGISNTLASAMPIITPLVVGWIVTDTHNRVQWQIVFAITALIFFIGNLFYIIWGSAETQAWDADNFSSLKNAEKSDEVDSQTCNNSRSINKDSA